MTKESIGLICFMLGGFSGIGILSYTYSKQEPPPLHDHSECEMQVGLLEDEIAQQHRDNDRLRQWLLGDLLSDGRLPPIEGLIDE